MKLYLLFSGIAFCYLWAMINDDHLPKLTSSYEKSTNNKLALVCGNKPHYLDTEKVIKGEKLFKRHCNSCHNRNMVDDMTGPALKGVTERWVDYPKEDLYAWVRNSQKMIGEGHPKAKELYKDWFPTVMTSFDLTDEEIEALLEYIELY